MSWRVWARPWPRCAGGAAAGEPSWRRAPARSRVGARPDVLIERIVTLRRGAPWHLIAGSDLVVALEKCGLVFG